MGLLVEAWWKNEDAVGPTNADRDIEGLQSTDQVCECLLLTNGLRIWIKHAYLLHLQDNSHRIQP